MCLDTFPLDLPPRAGGLLMILPLHLSLSLCRRATDDTATASLLVASQRMVNVGAISSSRSAELYGLQVLENGIQDLDNNVTRFVVLSR